MLAIEERDGVRFYVDRTSPFSPIRLIRTPGFGGDYLAGLVTRRPARLARRHHRAARGRRRAGGVAAARGRVGRGARRRGRCGSGGRWRRSSSRGRGRRGGRRAGGRAPRGRCSTRRRPRRCWRRGPGAIRFDAPAAGNRPGRHGLWQRPVERRRLRAAPLLVPWSEGGLAEAPAPHADAVVVPVPVAPSGERRRARHRRDHLRRAPGEEGPRPRARRVGRRAPRGRGARRRRARRGALAPLAAELPRRAAAARRPACASPARCRARSTARSCAARACSSPRRGGRTTGSRSSRRSPTAACSSRPPRPGPYAALPLARALDPRLVTEDLAGALRAALDEPGARLRRARGRRRCARGRPAEVDRVVADVLLPRLLDSDADDRCSRPSASSATRRPSRSPAPG